MPSFASRVIIPVFGPSIAILDGILPVRIDQKSKLFTFLSFSVSVGKMAAIVVQSSALESQITPSTATDVCRPMSLLFLLVDDPGNLPCYSFAMPPVSPLETLWTLSCQANDLCLSNVVESEARLRPPVTSLSIAAKLSVVAVLSVPLSTTSTRTLPFSSLSYTSITTLLSLGHLLYLYRNFWVTDTDNDSYFHCSHAMQTNHFFLFIHLFKCRLQ